MADTTSPTVAKSALPNRTDNWLQPRWFAAILGLFVVASFPQVVFGLQTFVYRDFGYFGYPLAHHFRESFWRGEFPLWNPLNNCGLPFLAQWNTQVLYPPSLFYLLFPLSWSLGVFCLLHMWFAGMGMYFLAHRWTQNQLAAAFGGIVFAFNGLMLNCLMWPNNIAALGWMPWVVWLMEKAWREGGRKIVVAAIVAALQMLSGGPEIILLTWVLIGALFLADFLRGEKSRRKIFLRTAAVVLLVTGLCAAQLLPFLQLLAHSHRDSSYSTSSWSMPVTGWANFFLPLFHAHPSFHGVFMQTGQGWTASYYAGVATIALGIFAVCKVRHWRIWLLAALTIFFLVLALGDAGFIYGWLRQHFGAVGFLRYPIKFVVLPIFILPLLAAFGIAHVTLFPEKLKLLDIMPFKGASMPVGVRNAGQNSSCAKKMLSVISCLCVVAIGILLWSEWKHPVQGDDWNATWHNAIFRVAFLAGIMSLLFTSRRLQAARSLVLIQLILLGAVWLDLLKHSPLQQTVSREIYKPNTERDLPPPTHGTSRAMVSPAASMELEHSYLAKPENDYLSRRWTLLWNCNLLDDIPIIDGFFSLYSPKEVDIGSILFHATNNLPRGLLDFLGIAMITSRTNIFDWEKHEVSLPLLTGGQKILFADATQTVAMLASDQFNPREQVFLPKETVLNASTNERTTVEISETKFSANNIEARILAYKPSIVVIAQSFYPNWKARVDDKPMPLLRANHAFQGVEIPAGDHRLTLVYKDKTFWIGSVISLISLALSAVAWLKLRSPKNA